MQANLEYSPKKKNRALKIIAQILSTLFTAVMVLGLISCFTTDAPQYIPFEEVNLYNANDYDVYELKDLKAVSKYSSDEDFDYYLVLLPYKDETIKAASFRCSKYYFDEDENHNEINDFVITVGVTVSAVDFYSDNILEDYNRVVDDLKNSGMNVMSTELDLTFACEANDEAFREYYDIDKSGEIFATVVLIVLFIAGVVLMIISFKNSDAYNQVQTYYVPGSHKTALDYDFDNRFE